MFFLRWMFRRFVHILLAGFVIGFICGFWTKAHAGTLSLNLNLGSVHTEQWARDALNQRNPGIGITYAWSRSLAVMVGEYFNSYRHITVYALGAYTPLHLGRLHHWHLDAGVVGGVASGYTRIENPYAPAVAGALVRITAPSSIGLNLLAVPNEGPRESGFIGFQIAVPLR